MILGVFIFLWVFMLFVFHKTKLKFQYFILGSIGLFFILANISFYITEYYTLYFVSIPMKIISNLLDWYTVYPEASTITMINNKQQLFTLFISHECSGIIEIMLYLSLISFFPLYKGFKRLFVLLFGFIYIIVSNWIRLLTVLILINYLDKSFFFMAHIVIAKFIFIVFIVFLYYHVFTKKHIKQQKVGGH